MKNKLLCLVLWLSGLTCVYAQEIPHVKLDRDCQACHQEDQWNRIHFDHDKTGFPLQFKHRAVSCPLCHDIRDFSTSRPVCMDCHLDVHQQKLGGQCDQCHDPQGWQVHSTLKAHANTAFPLIGAHARLDCKVCHTGEIQGEFNMLQSECHTCHDEQYRETDNPSHAAMGFPHRCDQCHTMFAWKPADFGDHNAFFPIYSGAHAGVWQDCSTCHVATGNYREFSCFQGCHEHNQSAMDSRHHEVRGYSYDSQRCYACHARGKGGD